MVNDLLSFKRVAMSLGLCDPYKKKWDECTDKRQLMDLALDSNGVDFIADSIAFGWGLGVDFFNRHFADYINGKYKRDSGPHGYSSEMLVGLEGMYYLYSTITLVAGCKCLNIVVPPSSYGRVYVCGGSEIHLSVFGVCEVYVYGDDSHVGITNHCRGAIKYTKTHIPSSRWNNRK